MNSDTKINAEHENSVLETFEMNPILHCIKFSLHASAQAVAGIFSLSLQYKFILKLPINQFSTKFKELVSARNIFTILS